MGLFKDIVTLVSDVGRTVLGWGARLLYGGLVTFLDIFMKKKSAKVHAQKILPVVLGTTAFMGVYWLWFKAKALWKVTTGILFAQSVVWWKRGMVQSALLSTAKFMVARGWVFGALYWFWGATFVYGVYVTSAKAISAK